MELAERMPRDIGHLRGIDGMPPRVIERYGRAVLNAVREGLNIPEADLPKFPRPLRRVKDPSFDDRVKILKKWRQGEAAKYALEPGVLINNAALEAVALAKPQSMVALDEVVILKNWQKEELGGSLLEFLA